MSHAEFALRVAVAIGCGMAIGSERQWRQRMAGLRTNALVAAGAALFASLGVFFSAESSGAARVAAQIVSGIGFLGGGVILREGLNVRGLNTAATLWCTAAVGTLAGLGLLFEAVAGSVFVVAANLLLRPIATRINRQPAEQTEVESTFRVVIEFRRRNESQVRLTLFEAIAKEPLSLLGIETKRNEADSLTKLVVLLQGTGVSHASLERLIAQLSAVSGVVTTAWTSVSSQETEVEPPPAPEPIPVS